jgi:phosphate transport system substrate-binding protein
MQLLPNCFRLWLLSRNPTVVKTKMKDIQMTLRKIAVSILLAGVAITASNASNITGRGASFPAPVYVDWSQAYFKATGNKVTYTGTGSGDGIKSINKQLVDFGGSDEPLKADKLSEGKLSMFPAIVGSIVLAYNIPGVADNQLKLSEKAIAAIFSGEAKFWDDAVITADNAGVALPHQPIIVSVRADSSGTTFNFTYYLNKLDRNIFSANKKPEWKGNIVGGKGNQGVTANIQQNKYSIGYIEYSYKLKSGLPAATVQNKEGKWIKPTVASFQDAAKYAKWDKSNDFYAMIAYPKGATSYPIVAASFILVANEKAAENKEVAKFFEWAFANGDQIAANLGYVPLPDETVREINAYWQSKGMK